jgi:26S proteasome regulatory subunit N9
VAGSAIMAQKPVDCLKAVFDSAPQLNKEVCSVLVSLYDRKLWHELSLKLKEIFDDEAYLPYLLDIFNGFILDFGHRINLLSFAKFAHTVAQNMDQDSAVALLKKQVAGLKELKGQHVEEPVLLLEMSIAEQYIDLTHMDDCKERLDSALKQLDRMSEVENVSS